MSDLSLNDVFLLVKIHHKQIHSISLKVLDLEDLAAEDEDKKINEQPTWKYH
jgi:hypothetical protein